MDVDDAAERLGFTGAARAWVRGLPDGVRLPDDAERLLGSCGVSGASLQRAFVTHLRAGRHWHTRTGILRLELAWG
ncbi:hypothetical protein ACXC9Q_18625 [Kribbella sp. CWNU-51]